MKGQQRRGEDHLARPALDHRIANRTGQNELGIQIDLDHLVPQFVGMFGCGRTFDSAGIVHQDVDLRMIRKHLFGKAAHCIPVGKIALIGGKVAAHRGDRFAQIASIRVHRRADPDDIGPSGCKCLGHTAANAAFRARHQCGFACQIKHLAHQAAPSLTRIRVFIELGFSVSALNASPIECSD